MSLKVDPIRILQGPSLNMAQFGFPIKSLEESAKETL